MNECKTTVINLFGGSGCGKSTTAALLFARMKLNGFHVELVREYVKGWAWGDRKVHELDQIYLLGKQSQCESVLYGKVDFVITDSPLLLTGVYQEYHSKGKDTYVGEAAKKFLEHSRRNGVRYVNFLLERAKPFDPRGRWETEDQAREIDQFIVQYLGIVGESFTRVNGPNETRDHEILSILQDYCK